eukprot:2778191-Amphidinium_carterae.1
MGKKERFKSQFSRLTYFLTHAMRKKDIKSKLGSSGSGLCQSDKPLTLETETLQTERGRAKRVESKNDGMP